MFSTFGGENTWFHNENEDNNELADESMATLRTTPNLVVVPTVIYMTKQPWNGSRFFL